MEEEGLSSHSKSEPKKGPDLIVYYDDVSEEDTSLQDDASGISNAPKTPSKRTASTTTSTSSSATQPLKPAPAGTFATALSLEKTKWSTKYKNQKGTKSPADFRLRIDAYSKTRKELFTEFHNETINSDAFKKAIESLGTDLAIAYMMAEIPHQSTRGVHLTQKVQWTREVESACMEGGKQYATPSRWSNTMNAIPGIVRSAAMLGLQAVKYVQPEYESSITMAQGAINLAYVAVQMYTLVYMPFWNASAQSEAVALQASRGPREAPDVKSDKLTAEDGKEGALRKKKDIQKDIDICDQALATNINDPTQKAKRRALELEALTGELYRQLVVTKNSGDARSARACINLMISTLTMFTAAAGYMPSPSATDFLPQYLLHWVTKETVPLLGNSGALALLVAQPALYFWMYTRGSGLDYLDKMATMFQIIAMTGKGNFDDGTGQISVTKLDKVMKGPIFLRVEYLKAVLEYDRKVYQTAMFALILKRSGSGDYAELEQQFKAYKTQREFRDELERLGKPHSDIWPKIDRVYTLYINNEKSLKSLADGNLDELLSGVGSHLPFPTQHMFLGALTVAQGGAEAARPENQAQDDRLSRLKGSTESLCDIGSIHQTAQKLGQALAWGVAGSSSFNALKGIGSLIQGGMMLSDADYSAQIRGVSVGVNSIQMVGSLIAMAYAYSYQKHISQKALNRGRDSGKSSMPNSGVMNRPWIRLDRMRQKVTQYRTLAAMQINPEDVKGLELEYVSDISLFADMVAQMGAVNLNPFKLAKYVSAKNGKLRTLDDKTAAQMIAEARLQLNQHVSDDDVTNEGVTVEMSNISGKSQGEEKEKARIPKPGNGFVGELP